MDLLSIAKAALAEYSKVAGAPDPETVSACWLLHFADREPLEITTSPPVAIGEMFRLWPDAMAAEPLPPAEYPPAGDAEVAVLTLRVRRELGWNDADLTAWLADVERDRAWAVAAVQQLLT